MRVTLTFLLSTLLLSGCATTPKPEEICSAAWIKPRVDDAVAGFRSDLDRTMAHLRDAGESSRGARDIGLLEGAAVLLSLTKLVNSLQDGSTLEDLQTLSETCNDPDLAIGALTDVLQEYQVPQPFIELLQELDAFRSFVEESQPI